MFTPADAPLALVGYSRAAALALHNLGLSVVSVPTDHPGEVAQACLTLRFAGALVARPFQTAWLGAVQPDSEAKRVGRVDAVSFHGAAGAAGTFAYADALSDALEASGYLARGAGLAVIGDSAADLALAAPLARLGFSAIGLVASSAPEAEKAIRDLPAGLRLFPMSRRDSSVAALTSRSDLIVLTTGELPAGALEPYHTLLDLDNLGAFQLARQLAHATGQRFPVTVLSEAAALAEGQ